MATATLEDDPFATAALATEAEKETSIPDVVDATTATACAELARIDAQLQDLKQKREMLAADLREHAERKRVELSQRTGFTPSIRYNGLKYVTKNQYSPVPLKSKPVLVSTFGEKFATYFAEGYEVTIKPEMAARLTVEQRKSLVAMGAAVKAIIKPTVAYHTARTMDATITAQHVTLGGSVVQYKASLGE